MLFFRGERYLLRITDRLKEANIKKTTIKLIAKDMIEQQFYIIVLTRTFK